MARRHLTTVVTMLVLFSLLGLGLVLGAKSLFAPLPTDTAASPTCTNKTVDAGRRIRSSQVEVSVFNGGTRSGLANQTLAALEKRGFQAGEAGNAPSDAKVKRVQVWSTNDNDLEAKLVARQFGPKVKVTFSDTDLGPGVDVIVGNQYSGLAKAKKTIKSRESHEVCVPDDDTNAAG